MAVKFIGEKIFLNEIESAGQIWVARGTHKNIYSEQLQRGQLSLPAWSSEERVLSFLQNARLIGSRYHPEAVPLKTFINAWLGNQSMAIGEIQINPDGRSSRVLVYETEEFISSQASS